MRDTTRIFILVAILTLVFGCNTSTSDNSRIIVSRWAGNPWEESTRSFASSWFDSTGIGVEIDALPFEALREKQVLELVSGTGSYDILYIHPSWFQEYANAGYLVDLYPYLNDPALNPPGFSPASFESHLLGLGVYDGKQYALQDFVSTVLLAYRKDLFEAENIPSPQSWSDILDAAAKLNGKEDMAGIVLPAKRTIAPTDIYGTLLLGAGTWYFDAQGKPALDVDKAAEALAFYGEMGKYAPDGLLNFHWDEATTTAAQGKAAMVISMTTTLAWLDDPERSSTAGKWAFTPIKYEGKAAGAINYWSWGVASSARDPQAAYAFLRWYIDGEQQKKAAYNTFTAGTTKDFYEDAAIEENLPFFAAMQEAFAHTEPQPSQAAWPQMGDIIDLQIQDVITGASTPMESARIIRAALDERWGN